MRSRSNSIFALLIVLLLSVGSLPGSALATNRQFSGTSYESPQFGYLVEWTDDWAARERDANSNSTSGDVMVLSNNAGRLQVIGQESDAEIADLLMTAVDSVTTGASEVTISSLDAGATVPTAIATADNTTFQIEIHDLGDAIVTVVLSARVSNAETALGLAQTGVTLNGTSLFTGEPVGPTTDVPDGTPTADDPETGIDGTTFTSPNYGFSVEWTNDWEAREQLGNDIDVLHLTSSTGSISIMGGTPYAGDAEACLDGESDYFENDDPNVTDWAPAVDRRGDEIREADDSVAYGIYTYAFGTEDDGFVDWVDYIECRTLEPDESTLVVVITTTPDLFEEHLEAALEISNAVEMPSGSELAEPSDPALPDFDTGSRPEEETPVTEATEEVLEPAETPVDTGESGLDGTTFTSPGFDFGLTIPDGWVVTDELIADGDERLSLSNGTSLITVRATDSIMGEPLDCIGAVEDEAKADPRFVNLQLASTSEGEPFHGSDDLGAYALFIYSGDDGSEWAYFVRCEPLVAGESMLIITQDVPYDEYPTERAARRVIQNAIERP